MWVEIVINVRSMKFEPTHTAIIYGFLPVYLDMTMPDVPRIRPRWFFLKPLIIFCGKLLSCYAYLRTTLDPTYDTVINIRVTSKVDGKVITD